ncbi:hypothetical protein RHMOL_Rhmol12G0221600 [Rhododendron molle]|uniref:Uncharacterized protein n=1 Tax=Rhododendron molle TaxID=49168 RepID=A0ACC0LM96_RHOML|nr:hypothetical protein RHMOL_Rhmol12G0221600 [Rhododendron molle]
MCAAPCCTPPNCLIVYPTAQILSRNERLSIVGCRDEIRAVGCTVRWLRSTQHGAVHLTSQYQPEVQNTPLV